MNKEIDTENFNITNKEIKLEFLEKIYEDILALPSSVKNYFNENNFNVYLFTLEENSDNKIKAIVVEILKAFIGNCKINSNILMFNILESVLRNSTSNDLEIRKIARFILSEIAINYDLILTAGFHKNIAEFVSTFISDSIKTDNCDINKLLFFYKKYSNILWKFEKKSTLNALTWLSEKLLVENDENLSIYIEIFCIMMQCKKISLKCSNQWCQNLAKFIFNALRVKNVLNSVELLNKILILSNSLLIIFSVDWIPTSNTDCIYNSELFLRNFYLLFSSLSSYVKIDLYMENNQSNDKLSQFVNSIEILLKYLKFINEEEDQIFSNETEMLLKGILLRVNENYDSFYSVINKINYEISNSNFELNEIIYSSIRSVWISNVILGKESSSFINCCNHILNKIPEKTLDILNYENIVNFDNLSHVDKLVLLECFHFIPALTLDLIQNRASELFISPFLMNLFVVLERLVKLHDIFQENIIIQGLINFLNLMSSLLVLLEDVEFFVKISQLHSLLIVNLNSFNDNKLKIAVGKFLVEFYIHPTIDETIDNDEIINLFVWIITKLKSSSEWQAELKEKFKILFDRFGDLRNKMKTKLQMLNVDINLITE